MLRIGLTGGIGSGKSTVAGLFSELGVPVIDADVIARELVLPGQPGLAELVRSFGDQFLVDGQLDRAALREAAFQSPETRRKLEQILHPLVFKAMDERAKALDSGYCIFAIPLLVETGNLSFVDRILVVDCPEATQRERVLARDRLSPALIDRIIASQASRSQRLAVADDLILNTGELAEVRQSVARLHRQYGELSRTGGACRAID